MKFEIHITTKWPTVANMKSAMEWLKDTYGGNVQRARGNHEAQFNMVLSAASFTEVVSLLTAVLQEYGTAVSGWNLQMESDV